MSTVTILIVVVIAVGIFYALNRSVNNSLAGALETVAKSDKKARRYGRILPPPSSDSNYNKDVAMLNSLNGSYRQPKFLTVED